MDVFCAHDTVTGYDPLGPLPLVGETVIQDPFPDAVQFPPVHPSGEPVIPTGREPASDVTSLDVRVSEKLVHACCPESWLICKMSPAIVALPVRGDTEVFCAHDTVTAPDPLPLVGETVIQDPFPDAVQLPPVHPAGEPVMVTSCEFAAESTVSAVGLIEKLVHGGTMPPPWLTAKLLAAIVALPDRNDTEGFCAHDTVTELDPLPLVGETVIQDPFPDAVQLPPVQPAGEPMIVTTCEPAADPGLAEGGLIEKLVQVNGTVPPW